MRVPQYYEPECMPVTLMYFNLDVAGTVFVNCRSMSTIISACATLMLDHSYKLCQGNVTPSDVADEGFLRHAIQTPPRLR